MSLRYSQRKAFKELNPNHQIKILSKQRCNPQRLVQLFENLKHDGIEYDHDTYFIAHKALIKIHCQNQNIKQAQKVWNEIISNDKYKSKLTNKDYHTVIATFLRSCYTQTAMTVFDQMLQNGEKPDFKSYKLIIKAATHLKSLKKANEIYELMISDQPHFAEAASIQNLLMRMYLNCGDMNKAQIIFQSKKHKQNTVTFNILLNGMIEDDKPEEAMNLFNEMIKQKISPDDKTYCCIIKAISKMKSIEEANGIYEMIENDPNIQIYEHISIYNSCITMFGICGCMDKAIEIWNYLENNKLNIHIGTWNVMMDAHLLNKNYQQILDLYDQLMKLYHGERNITKKMNIKPQIRTFAICIEACTQLNNSEFAELIQIALISIFSHITHPTVYHALINMLCQCVGLDKGIEIWRKLMIDGTESVAKFTFMIRLCIKYGNNMQAFELFDEMQNVYNLQPDTATFITILKACGSHEPLIKKMHQHIILAGEQCANEHRVVSTLITAYNSCGNQQMAKELLRHYQSLRNPA